MSDFESKEKETINLKRQKQNEEIEKLPLVARLELQRRRSVATSALDEIYNLPEITQPLYRDINSIQNILEKQYLIHVGIAVAALVINHFAEITKNIEWIFVVLSMHMAYIYFNLRFEKLEMSMKFNLLSGRIAKAQKDLDDIGVYDTSSLNYRDREKHKELVDMINPYSPIPEKLDRSIDESIYGNMKFYNNLDEQLLNFMGIRLNA